MDPSTGERRRRSSRTWCMAAVALLAAPFTPVACALDVSQKLALPATIDDGTLEVAGRRLRLPPGAWTLTGQRELETVGSAHGAETWGRGVSAWATLVEHGHLRAIVWLSLPVQDMRNVRRDEPGCASGESAIERLNLSSQLSKPECLAVYGERDLRTAVGTRSPNTLRWLARQHVADPGPLVRFVYKLRSESSYGSFALILPTGPFDSDEEARHWALGLRESLRSFLEHRTSDASVPALPALESSGNAMGR